jgi:hypothetical protein
MDKTPQIRENLAQSGPVAPTVQRWRWCNVCGGPVEDDPVICYSGGPMRGSNPESTLNQTPSWTARGLMNILSAGTAS